MRHYTPLVIPLQRQVPSCPLRVALLLPSSLRYCSSTHHHHQNDTFHFTPERGNFFKFYTLPRSPRLDENRLQKQYHNLQRRVHPDQENVTSSEAPTDLSERSEEERKDLSVYGNLAYETLRDPFLRCRYLSRLARYEAAKQKNSNTPLTVKEEEDLANDDDQRSELINAAVPMPEMSETFLMEIMSMNDLIFTGDPHNEEERNQMLVLKADLEERSDEYYDRALALWEAGDLEQFHIVVAEWTYIYNALRHLINRL